MTFYCNHSNNLVIFCVEFLWNVLSLYNVQYITQYKKYEKMGEKLVESATFLNKKNSEYIVHVYSTVCA